MEKCEHAEESICNLPPVEPRKLDNNIDSHRESLIRYIEKKWVNHTTLHYVFMDSPRRFAGASNQKQAVREAFAEWKALGIGLNFEEVVDRTDAELRIAFEPGGSWSYVGRDNVDIATDLRQPTMNFGWDLTTPYGRSTALHEIGHALGFPHEHQNPNAGIVWDEESVYRNYAGPPNNWPRERTYHNIIRKISSQAVGGSTWDPESVMHYSFNAGLILEPSKYRTEPLDPTLGLSEMDKAEVRKFYPPAQENVEWPELTPFLSQIIDIQPGEQFDFTIKPSVSRQYTMQTFGGMDTVMVLFEDDNGESVYLAGDDDSGSQYNAQMKLRLIKGRTYYLRIRLYTAGASGAGAVMLW